MTIEKSKPGPKARAGKTATNRIQVKLTDDEKNSWQEMAVKAGAKNVSEWLRQLVAQAA